MPILNDDDVAETGCLGVDKASLGTDADVVIARRGTFTDVA
jgi:hypothetical protein